jgi:hypothetical protein
MRRNFLNGSLATQTNAAIRLGLYPQAEAAARERVSLPPNPFSAADPQDDRSRAAVMLAHAVAMQGRGEEARTLVQPELARYRGEQKHGARGVTFHVDLAYALYVDALAQPGDPAGHARRDASLAEAAKLLNGLSTEATQLADIRELTGWIAAARSGSGA